MRIGLARRPEGLRPVVVDGDDGLLLPVGAPGPDEVVREPGARAAVEAALGSAERVPLSRLDLAAPLRRFNRDVLCTGWNYWDHFEESRGKREGQDPEGRPERPTFFTKGPDSIIGPSDPVAWDPALSQRWDYEVELAVVIGLTGRSIPEDRAMEHVAGYLVANDVSQRDLQRAHGGQWLKGKSIDGGSPLGPWLTTADEIPDPAALDLTFELNGEVLQSASTAQMAFSLPQIVAELSQGMTLRAGDVILTGTPAGIGNAREPQVFLREGDVLVSRISGLGELRNVVTRATLVDYLRGEAG